MKIVEIFATTCQILRLKCTKFDFSWGFDPEPDGELTALPDSAPQTPVPAFKGPTSRRRDIGRESDGKFPIALLIDPPRR